ncbi:MAG: phage portal protein [Clostridiales bacterium]|nr:phage portal protein [Clostridiales bacterium]
MSIFSRFRRLIEGVIRKMIPYKNIEQVEHVETPLSTEMENALDTWYQLYLNKADWLKQDTVKSMNLPAFISSEVARQVTLEMKWNITGKGKDGENQTEDGEDIMNPRAEYLKAEFEKLMDVLRLKLEQGCAAGGMVIKPYPNTTDGHIYFDWAMDWALYPMAFDDDGNLSDVIIPDSFTEGKTIYTRLERHTVEGNNVRITQRAFKSNNKNTLGTEISLTEVERWKSVEPEALVNNTDGPLFGWFKAATANNVDVDSPLGASVYAKAVDVIREADMQYSRLLWEFEGSELAIDVDPTVLRPKTTTVNGKTVQEMPKLNERLFRGVDLGEDDTYNVFAPSIRDTSLLNGLNQLLIRVEDLCGLSRGTLSDANVDARTATELKIVKQRSYATIADNQKALESCLKNVIRAMDKYATMYHLAPEGEYDVSFEWDDSIITDTEQQMNERLMLLNAGIIGKAEFREWYFGETSAQAQAAIEALTQEQLAGMEQMMPALDSGEPAP